MEFSDGTHWNISKTTCLMSYSNNIYLVNNQRYILTAVNVTLMILNLQANSAVLIVLFASKFRHNTSYILLFYLTLSWRRPLSYRNQFIDLRSKSMDWFLYDNGLRHERVKYVRLPFSFGGAATIFDSNC